MADPALDPAPEPNWADSIEDEGLKETLGKFESQEKLFDAIGYKVPEPSEPKDWREGLPEDLKKTADRFTSPEDAIRSIEDFRKRDSQVRVPGKDATDDEKVAYNKAIGVPDKPEDYEFKLAEGEEVTPEIEASNKAWGERLHQLKIPVETVNELVKFLHEDVAVAEDAVVKADEDFAKAQEDALKVEWKGDDYEKNKTFANRAFSETANRAGISLDELTKIETKDGRFLMDDARMLKLFSVIGREMSEGTLGPTLTDIEKDTIQDQLSDIRKQITEAQSVGDSKKANSLYTKEQALIAKMDGDKTIVGASGRTA